MSVNKGLFTSDSMEWATPKEFFAALDSEFRFTLDPCATDKNHKCKKYYTKEDNGLLQDWSGEVVFCNPPYGRELPKWIKKCSEESKRAKVVMLIPARTDTAAFHDHIYGKAEIRFIRGRIKFEGAKYNAPFPSMVVVFRRECEK